MPVSGQNQVSVKVTRKGQLHLMTSTFNNLSAKILFYSKDTLKQAYKRINSFKNKQKQANHNNTECNLSRVARGAELQGFSLLHPVVPPWVALGTVKQAGNSSVMSFVYLVILLVQVVVIFSLFLFRALIPCVSLSHSSFYC